MSWKKLLEPLIGGWSRRQQFRNSSDHVIWTPASADEVTVDQPSNKQTKKKKKNEAPSPPSLTNKSSKKVSLVSPIVINPSHSLPPSITLHPHPHLHYNGWPTCCEKGCCQGLPRLISPKERQQQAQSEPRQGARGQEGQGDRWQAQWKEGCQGYRGRQ